VLLPTNTSTAKSYRILNNINLNNKTYVFIPTDQINSCPLQFTETHVRPEAFHMLFLFLALKNIKVSDWTLSPSSTNFYTGIG